MKNFKPTTDNAMPNSVLAGFSRPRRVSPGRKIFGSGASAEGSTLSVVRFSLGWGS
jgi:hypothetical protein